MHISDVTRGRTPLVSLKKWRCVAAVLLCILAAFASLAELSPSAYAEPQDATLTLQTTYTKQGSTRAITGVTATAYLVASLDQDLHTYTLTAEFSNLDVDLNGKIDAATLEKLAAQAATIAANNNLQGVSATSGRQGTLPFGVLPYGLYLVVQTGRAGTARSYENFTPFLIGVPQVTSTEVEYDVTCMPKFVPIDKPYEPVNPNEVDVPDEPDEPDNPDNPDEPDKPDEPDNPDNPDNPTEPDKPTTPNNPSEPGTPSSPTTPGTSNNTSEYDADNPTYRGNQTTTSSGSGGTTLSHTADSTMVAAPFAVLLIAAVLVVAGIKTRRL